MGWFKSEEEKRLERNLEVKKGIKAIKRNIKELERNREKYIEKAKRARKIGDDKQYEFLKRALKKTEAQKKMRERQLLNIETALQIKNQAESDAEFAKAMQAVSESISEVYGATDMVETQKQFQKALAQAETLQERMEYFLDMNADTVFSEDLDIDEDVVSDEEIEDMISDEVNREESEEIDREIEEDLKEIEAELEQN